MRKSLNVHYGEDFFSRFPNLYRVMWEDVPTCPLSERGGVECGPGWKPVIEELSAKLEALILALPEPERRKCFAAQVKEKFGTLRFYMRGATEEMRHEIGDAEGRTLSICHACGAALPRRLSGCAECGGVGFGDE